MDNPEQHKNRHSLCELEDKTQIFGLIWFDFGLIFVWMVGFGPQIDNPEQHKNRHSLRELEDETQISGGMRGNGTYGTPLRQGFAGQADWTDAEAMRERNKGGAQRTPLRQGFRRRPLGYGGQAGGRVAGQARQAGAM